VLCRATLRWGLVTKRPIWFVRHDVTDTRRACRYHGGERGFAAAEREAADCAARSAGDRRRCTPACQQRREQVRQELRRRRVAYVWKMVAAQRERERGDASVRARRSDVQMNVQENEAHPPGATTRIYFAACCPAKLWARVARLACSANVCMCIKKQVDIDIHRFHTHAHMCTQNTQCVGSLPATPDLADEMNRVEVQFALRTATAFSLSLYFNSRFTMRLCHSFTPRPY